MDNYKIPTTFGQLTKISPTYTEEILKKLMARIPKKTSVSISQGSLEEQKVKAGMILNKAKGSEERCLFSCTLGYLETQVQGKNMEFLVDSGSMVNVIPSSVALDLGLEVIKVEMGMIGISGQKFSIKGVVECCPITIGRFTGPVHLFVAPQA